MRQTIGFSTMGIRRMVDSSTLTSALSNDVNLLLDLAVRIIANSRAFAVC